MKACNGNELLINMYIDGELTCEQEKQLIEHMNSCDACRCYYEQLRSINCLMSDMDFPEDLHGSIMVSVNKERKKKKLLIFKRPAFIGSVAALIMVALVGIISVKSGIPASMIACGAGKNEMLDRSSEGILASAAAVPESGQVDLSEEKVTADSSLKASENAEPRQIETPMLAWFNNGTGNVTVLNEPEAQGIAANQTDEVETSENSEGQTDSQSHDITSLAAALGDEADGYGFYLVAYGSLENLPDVFAEQAEGAEPGYTLLISVKNDLTVKKEVGCSMTENGFEIYDDADGVYFNIDDQAEDGLLIVELNQQ
ncbi:MAG: zf-HC2 domain-containing protein [Clostridiaceae bacterium]|nr:zf-HC2 domain-containing protein [Clostridiaceae bacterium]